jgi:hypothetical protein
VTTKQFKIPMPRFGERRLSLYRPFWIAINPEFNPHEREVADSLPSPKRPSRRLGLPSRSGSERNTRRLPDSVTRDSVSRDAFFVNLRLGDLTSDVQNLRAYGRTGDDVLR